MASKTFFEVLGDIASTMCDTYMSMYTAEELKALENTEKILRAHMKTEEADKLHEIRIHALHKD